MAKHWFVEESMPDGTYRVIQRGMDEGEALDLLQSHSTINRLEMWCESDPPALKLKQSTTRWIVVAPVIRYLQRCMIRLLQ